MTFGDRALPCDAYRAGVAAAADLDPLAAATEILRSDARHASSI
jgi:hypothetical protein